jgi:FMN phosphatase YigB (HAD superfamily)
MLVDCDGVLLNWESPFDEYVRKKYGVSMVDSGEYYLTQRYGIDSQLADVMTKDFNQSSEFSDLPVLPGAVEALCDIHRRGVTIICVTSTVAGALTGDLRKKNLAKHFGSAIGEIHLLNVDQCKRAVLSQWRDSGHIWVEDLPKNAIVGAELGLRSILIDAPYNRGDYDLLRVYGDRHWDQIHTIAVKHYGI